MRAWADAKSQGRLAQTSYTGGFSIFHHAFVRMRLLACGCFSSFSVLVANHGEASSIAVGAQPSSPADDDPSSSFNSLRNRIALDC